MDFWDLGDAPDDSPRRQPEPPRTLHIVRLHEEPIPVPLAQRVATRVADKRRKPKPLRLVLTPRKGSQR